MTTLIEVRPDGRCARCLKRRSVMAARYRDPHCSRECAELAYGTREQNQLSLKDPEENRRIPAYRGPATDLYQSHIKRWDKRRRAG